MQLSKISTRTNDVFGVPIQKLRLGSVNIECRCVRDDLFPLTGGGNKARKIQYIINDGLEKGYNAFVTNGGVQSNHTRATALLAAQYGLKCSLVLHSEEPESSHPAKGNLMMMMMSGADIRFCYLSELSKVMDEEVERMKRLGYNPLYIWGGGHCFQGTLAYYDAAIEAKNQCGEWVPDYVVHASGTGTTQAGLVGGYAELPTKVIGISVARESERGGRIVKESLLELGDHLKKDFSYEEIIFRDDWTFGGYENYSQELIETVNHYSKKGLILDPTYTGKAWHGLMKMVETGEIPEGSKLLFWHTGGLLNLMSHPVYCNKRI